MLFHYKKGKNAAKKKFAKCKVRILWVNAGPRSDLFDSVVEISMSKMRLTAT